MIISLFSAGAKSLLGVKEDRQEIQIFPFNSKILFHNPSLFYSRFLKLLQRKYPKVLDTSMESGYLINNMIFSFPGKLDSNSGLVQNSHHLDQISHPKTWGGFNFKACFEDLLTWDNIHLVNAAKIAGFGVNTSLKDIMMPAMVILLESNVSAAMIDQEGFVSEVFWQNEPLDNLQGKTANECLSTSAIDEIISCGTIGIIEVYTNTLSEVISKFTAFAQNNGSEIKSVAILTDKNDLIDESFLSLSLAPLSVTIPEEKIKNDILLKGSLHFLEQKVLNPEKVIRIEYWSAEEQIYVFKKFEDFLSHWRSKKPVANPENEYRIYYNEGYIKRVKIKDITFEEQIMAFMF